VEKGFDAMSLRDLQAKSGLSMGCLYSYFSGKEALLNLMQEQGRRLVSSVMAEALKAPVHPIERLETAIRTHLYLSEIMHPWFYFSYMETKNLGREETRKAIESELLTESIFVEILEHGKAAGDFQVQDTRLTAAMIKAMLQDWYLKRWKYKRRKIHVDAYATFLISFIHAALTPPVSKASGDTRY
jgi:AcrR family transcriptional regulator